MTDAPDRPERSPAAGFLESTPDWTMLALSLALVAGWLLWIAATTYRLIVAP